MPRFHVVTFGCQMNQHDSDRIEDVLERAGYARAGGIERADVILLNTCSVREKAEQKLRSEVGRLARLKRQRPDLVLGVAGCVAQQEGERLLSSMPSVDLLLGPDNIPELPGLLADLEQGGLPRVRTVFDLDEPSFLTAVPRSGAATAFVTTMKGCDERCSYCIVPHTRGPERYRPSAEILDEVERLVAAGVKEITLLGQTVDSYRDPRGALPEAPEAGTDRARLRGPHADESEFPALLRAIAERVPSLERLRYTSPHPRHLTPSLVAAHRDLAVLARHVHMPVQSGSDRVLKRMIRRYSVAEYLERTDALKAAVPGLTLSTDIIVGFPGETREDFEQTLRLVERAGFIGAFAFKYSERPYTPAQKLADDVPESEKSARLSELFELTERQRRAHLETLVGTVQRVLVEGRGKLGDFCGRTERNEIVHLGSRDDPTGELVEVRITRANKHSLAGELTDAERAAPLGESPPAARRVSLPVAP